MTKKEKKRLDAEARKRALEDKVEKDKEEIIKYTKDGYQQKEIAKMINISLDTFYRRKTELEEEGRWFTDEEINAFREARRQRDALTDPKVRQRDEDILRLKQCVREGYFYKEASKILNMDEDRIKYLINYCKKQNMWFSKEELQEYHAKSLEIKRAQRERKKAEEKRQKALEIKRQDEEEMQEYIGYVRGGFSNKEIAQKMYCSKSKIKALKEKYIASNGSWFTDGELEKFAAKRKIDEERQRQEEEKRRKKEEIRKLEQQRAEERARRQQEKKELKQATEEQRRKKKEQSSFNKLFLDARKRARAEENLEYGEYDDSQIENADISKRKAFVKLFEEAYKKGYMIGKKDLELAMNFVYSHPKAINASMIKGIVLNSRKVGGIQLTQTTVAELIRELDGTIYHDKLVEYSVWVRKIAAIPEMIRMRNEGISDAEISSRLRVSTTEIRILLGEDSAKIPILPDDLE